MGSRGGGSDVARERIGIMGGAFNPIHHGHLVTAEEARTQFHLDRVIFMPTGSPPHKHMAAGASSEDRYAMVSLAIASNPYFGASRMEVDKADIAYTVDTLRELRKGLGRDVSIFFITGADAILDIMTWKDPAALTGLCEFIAATRPGYSLENFRQVLRQVRGAENASIDPAALPIHQMSIPALSISSTDIRERVRSGRSIRYLVPESVAAYIHEHGLYGVASDRQGGAE